MTTAISLLCIVLAVQAQARPENDHSAQKVQPSKPEAEFDGKPGVVTGYLRDVACLFRNEHAGAPDTPDTLACTEQCVRDGSPIVILSTDGKLYFVISELIPDKSEANRFQPNVGKLVRASGRVFERAGSRAIAIKRLEVVTTPTK